MAANCRYLQWQNFKETQTETANALLASPHFQAKGGMDHLLVADSYKLWDMERNSEILAGVS